VIPHGSNLIGPHSKEDQAMTNQPTKSSATMEVVIILLLAALAVGAWQFGLFDRDSDEDEQAVYEAGVTDVSGGELIVTDADAPRIEDLELPQTPMTPVPPTAEMRPAPSARTEAE
jgi:hypothetical protein